MAQAREDRFANVAAAAVVMDGANSLTFEEMLTGVSLGQGVGMLIDEIDYYVNLSSQEALVVVSDDVRMAVTANDQITNLGDMEDRRILHSYSMTTVTVGAVTGISHLVRPAVYQFFPPMIIAAPRIFVAMDTSGFAAPASGQVRVYFRYITLTPQQYLELAEAFVLTG